MPLEWHKNKSVNSYYTHTYGLWFFIRGKISFSQYLQLIYLSSLSY